MRIGAHWHRTGALVAALSALSACGGGDSGTGPTTKGLTRIAVSPASLEFSSVGETGQITAEAFDKEGRLLLDVPIAWSTSDAAVARVDAVGLVTAAGNGMATISAANGSVSGTVSVTVQQRVTGIDVTPGSTLLAVVGETVQLAATGRDAAGSAVPGLSFFWSSADPSVALVDQAGLVTGVGVGVAIIQATSGGVMGSASVKVAS